MTNKINYFFIILFIFLLFSCSMDTKRAIQGRWKLQNILNENNFFAEFLPKEFKIKDDRIIYKTIFGEIATTYKIKGNCIYVKNDNSENIYYLTNKIYLMMDFLDTKLVYKKIDDN